MKKAYDKFIVYFIPEQNREDIELLRKSRFAVTAIWLFNLLDIVSIITFSGNSGDPVADQQIMWLPNAILFVLKIVFLFIFRKTGSLSMLAHLVAVLNSLIVFASAMSTCGIYDPNISWLVISCIMALAISSIRIAIFWSVFSFAEIVFFFLNESHHWIVIPNANLYQTPGYYITALLGLVFIVTLLVVRGEWIRLKIAENLKLSREELSVKNKEITDSITYAQRIQKAILPSQRILDHFLPGNFLVYLPKDIVSGDFYWVEKKGDKTFFAVVDCTGHGVPGAMMSVIGQNALNRVLNEFNLTDPAKMLDKLNDLVEESFSKSGADIRDGMDIALCAIDYKKMELEYAGANNEIYIISKGLLQVIRPTKQPIGRFESKVPFEGHHISLQKDDSVYLFSDGIADQFGGPQGKKFKYKRVKEMLLAHAAQSPGEQKNNILTTFSAWKGKLEQVDDVCLMGIRL